MEQRCCCASAQNQTELCTRAPPCWGGGESTVCTVYVLILCAEPAAEILTRTQPGGEWHSRAGNDTAGRGILPPTIFCRNGYFCEDDIFSLPIFCQQRYFVETNIFAMSIFAAKYQRRKNISIAKITVSTKYRCRQSIGIAKISVSTKYRWKLRWRVIKLVVIKVAC